MTFPTYRLPPDIEEGAQGGPEFATVIQESVSGQEQRIKVWAKCRARYDIAYSVLHSDDPVGSYRAVLALFYAHNGRFRPFRFKDWSDFEADDTSFGVGDAAETAFQLTKTYDPSLVLLDTPGSFTYTREIYLLSTTPTIKVNGVTQTVTTHYTIGDTGLVTFVTPPPNGHALTWTGEFDIPVRFDIDHLPVVMNVNSIANISSISLREVIGAAELRLMRDYNITLSSTTLFLARVVKITRLDGAILRIAEADEPLTVSAETFAPLPGAEISAVKHIINGDIGSMEIRFAHSDGGTLDTFELNTGFWDGATVQMYLVDRLTLPALGDPMFTGIIDVVTIDLIGSSGSFDIRGLSVQTEAFIQTFQPMCRTDLFSSLCSLNEADWDHAGTVDMIIDRFNFTVAGLSSPPADGWFNQGTFVTESGFKGIVANWLLGSLKITTYQPVCMSRLTLSENIILYPGCDKTGTTCRTKFTNKINFQGEDHFLGINSITGI